MAIPGVMEAYLSLKPRLNGLKFREFLKNLRGVVIHPVHYHGRAIGAILVKNHEIHACVLPEYTGKWFNKEHIKILNDVISKHGKAATRTSTDNGRKFVERLGFKKVGDHYERTELWALKH